MDFINQAKENQMLVITTAIISAVTTVIILMLAGLVGGSKSTKKARINNSIKLDAPKVVDMVKVPEIENLPQCKDGKAAFCRCWKSSTFPYCDGSHNNHNKETGDNVAPVIVSFK